MGDKASIAVLLATYNGARFISVFLDSLVRQSLKDFVVYVRDDGSSDDTIDIVRSYADKLDIVLLETQRRLGPARSFMALLRQAGDTHAYYAFADQDDYWNPTKLERASRALDGQDMEPSLYFSRVEYVDQNLSHLGFSPIYRRAGLSNALVENIAMGCTSVTNRAGRELILRTEPVSMIMHDWWVYIVISAFGRTFSDDFVSLQYRQHGNNTIGASVSLIEEYRKKVIRFMKQDRGIFRVSDQANQLMLCYGDRLSPDQRKMLDLLLDGKKSIFSRLRLCLFSPFARQRVVDTLILRGLFLLNRY